ncbi:MAG: hypothetical protein RLZZ387_3950 [Chloroflexota bacterium]|jgi:SpoVK/Ycf46/Vps4 family AAA+-type ATPase
MATSARAWQEANRVDLMARLARLRWLLLRALDRAEAQPPEPGDGDSSLAMPRLARAFDLSPFERDLLLLCAAVELDSGIAALCAELNGDPRRPSPSFGLAMTVLPDAHWSALTPGAPLRHWQLLAPGPGELLSRAPLAIDERALHLIAGADELDARLAALLVPAPPHDAPPDAGSAEAAAQALAAGRLVVLSGADYAALVALAANAAQRAGMRPHLVRAADLPDDQEERRLLARLWEREARLSNAALVLDLDGDERARGVELAGATTPALLVSERPGPISARHGVVRLSPPARTPTKRLGVWEQALGPHGASLNGALPRLAAQFRLPPATIQAAAADALAAQTAESEGLERRLWYACRRQARPSLDDLAQRIVTRRGWDDLVLPERQHDQLREITAHVAQRRQVYEVWGFDDEGRGADTGVIFAGASGTGKTLAAEVLANKLHLDLYRVDLSGVVSKYIGETEKNLRRVFAAAEYGGAILLFDEADALFGKRSEVRDSHDRYANIEVSYLLQQMEAYRGLAVLTTNMLENFDRAFLRRVRFVVQFPFPGPEQRAAIWRRVFPAGAETEGLDTRKLARLSVAGGNIRTIALNAAFLAAHAGEPIRMRHLRRAAAGEYAKLERPLPDAETRDWIDDDATAQHRH